VSADGKRARDDLLDALTAERYAPVPPRPPPPGAAAALTPEQSQRNRRLLARASRPHYPEHW
jgi:hypothetical protein